MNFRFSVLVGMIVFAAIARLIPHPWNFTPVAAMALFGGARFSKSSHAYFVVFGALFLSDLFIGLYPRLPIVYVAFAVIIRIGIWLRNKKGVMPIAGAVLLSSLSFYLITNFGVWAFGTIYPKTINGLFQSYIVGIPYFRNELMGSAFYSLLLFGGFHLAEKRFPVLRSSVSLTP